jgi:hypothetical protein
VPAGWTITGGAGTTGITVTTGAAGQNGNITVTSGNSCGTSAASTLNVVVDSRPVPLLTGTNAVCIGAIEIYSSDVSNSGYTWNVTGGTISSGGTASDATATITWTTLGDQSISVNYTNANGCTANTATQLPVHVFKKPETGPSFYIPNQYNQ